MALICLKCGYKQNDEETIKSLKARFPGVDEHDIPYYCGACQDNADDDEYEEMMKEMKCENETTI